MSERRVKTIGIAVALVVVAGLFVGTVRVQAETSVSTEVKATVVVENVPKSHGKIDWGNGVITARGMCTIDPKAETAAQAEPRARRGAIADGQRNLRELVLGARVDGDSQVTDHMSVSDEVRSRVNGVLRGFSILKEDVQRGTYIVEMAIRLYRGRKSVAKAVLPELDTTEKKIEEKRKAEQKEPPKPVIVIPENQPEPPTPLPQEQQGPFTGLIIDTRGLALQPAMCPKIKNEKGDELWGSAGVSDETALEYGVIGYHSSLDSALKHPRAGKNPLSIRAIGNAGPFHADVVVSEADGKRILEENSKTRFLDTFCVLFVYADDEGGKGIMIPAK